MSVAKTGAIPNSYRQIHIAVDDFENRILKGRINHESKEYGIVFYSLSEMVFALEELFEEIHYPMKSVDHRNFSKKEYLDLKEESREVRIEGLKSETRGKLADFCLRVQYRYYASWQGQIEQIGTNAKRHFDSFMELMDFLDQQLGEGVTRLPYGLGKKMCEVTVNNYEGHVMSGDVSHPAVEDRRAFYNEFELREKIAEMMSLFPDARQTDWDKVIAEKKGRLQTATERLKDCDAVLKQAEQELKNRTDGWEQFKKEYAAFCEAYRDQSDTTAERLREIDIRLRDLSGSIEELRHKRRIVSAGIDGLSNKLAGSITCPFCGHEFLVAEPQFDIEAGMKELKLRQRQLTEINGRIDEKQEETDAVELQQNRLNHERRILEGRRTGWEEQLAGHERAIRNATRHVEEVESGHKRIASEITALQSEIEGVRRKVFDEVFGFIDERNAALNRGIRVGKEDIQAAACAIDTLQATIRELDEAASPDLIQSLKDTLRETRGKSNEAAGRKTAVDARVRALEIQRERFVQFKTYLANTKIEALSRITNEFLQDIGSDIRIRFDGYTVLKSGKVREKISISLLRDGMDCGSFGKFSAGEAARVNLATILAMQKLVNSNCDGDKGLDLLVLDEILEAVDEAGLASMFEALNSLGGTVLVVSHGNVAEGYPHKLVIVKENGESRLGE